MCPDGYDLGDLFDAVVYWGNVLVLVNQLVSCWIYFSEHEHVFPFVAQPCTGTAVKLKSILVLFKTMIPLFCLTDVIADGLAT